MSERVEGQGFGERTVDRVLRWRSPLLMLIAAVTVWAGLAALHVGVDNSVEIWFLDNDPTLVAYKAFQETFGNDEVVIVGVEDTDGDVLDADGLAHLRAVSRAAGTVDGIADTRSAVTIPTVHGGDGTVEVGPIDDPALVRRDPLLRTTVSEDGRMGLVLARMKAMADIDARRDGILANLRAALAEAVPKRAARLYYAGIGVIYAALNHESTEGAALFIAAAYLVILALMWWLYGRLGPLVLTLGVVGLGATWLVGLMGATGRDINMVTMVMPTLVLVIGVSDCVHMLSHVAEQPADLPAWERVRRGIGFVFWPCLFNSLTTIMGFLALVTAAMPVVRDLGIYSAVGLGFAFVLAVVLCSVAAVSVRFQPRHAQGSPLQRIVDAMAGWAVDHPRTVLVASAFAGLIAALGMTRIVVDTWSIDFLPADHPVRQDSRHIERVFGPYTPLEFVVHNDEGVKTPAVMGAIAEWEKKARALSEVGWTRSAADVIERLDEVMRSGSGEVAAGRIPTDPTALDQLLFLYDSDPDSDLSHYVSADGTEARVTMGVPMTSARGFADIIRKVGALAKLPPHTRLVPSGYLPLYVRMMDYIVRSQLSSFAIAFLVIFALIGLLFRSVRMAALAIPANLLPVLFTLGLMGLSGIRLDVATVTIAAIVLGLVVDDTVQFLYRYRYEARRHDDIRAAVRAAIRGVGRPMAMTTIVFCGGFAVLSLAAIKSVAYLGLLIAFAMAVALVSDLMMVPALIVAIGTRADR